MEFHFKPISSNINATFQNTPIAAQVLFCRFPPLCGLQTYTKFRQIFGPKTFPFFLAGLDKSLRIGCGSTSNLAVLLRLVAVSIPSGTLESPGLSIRSSGLGSIRCLLPLGVGKHVVCFLQCKLCLHRWSNIRFCKKVCWCYHLYVAYIRPNWIYSLFTALTPWILKVFQKIL